VRPSPEEHPAEQPDTLPLETVPAPEHAPEAPVEPAQPAPDPAPEPAAEPEPAPAAAKPDALDAFKAEILVEIAALHARIASIHKRYG